jgi:hypothetical protein
VSSVSLRPPAQAADFIGAGRRRAPHGGPASGSRDLTFLAASSAGATSNGSPPGIPRRRAAGVAVARRRARVVSASSRRARVLRWIDRRWGMRREEGRVRV